MLPLGPSRPHFGSKHRDSLQLFRVTGYLTIALSLLMTVPGIAQMEKHDQKHCGLSAAICIHIGPDRQVSLVAGTQTHHWLVASLMPSRRIRNSWTVTAVSTCAQHTSVSQCTNIPKARRPRAYPTFASVV